MTRPIRRRTIWPANRESTRQVGPYPVWEVFFQTTLRKHFPDSTCPIEPEDESLFRDYYIARRSYQKGERGANEKMSEWQKRIETERGENFYTKYRQVLNIILQETSTLSFEKERKH